MKSSCKFIFSLLVLVGLSFIACTDKEDNDPDDNCGAADMWFGSAKLPATKNFLLSTDRYLYYEDANTPNDICADNIITATFTVTAPNNVLNPDITSVQGKMYWGLNEEKYVTLNQIGTAYVGTITGDLSGFFGEAPGWVGLTLIFKMPTKGSEAEDLMFIDANTDYFTVNLDYNHY